MNTTNRITRFLALQLPAMLCLPFASCGNYETTTPVTSSQAISRMAGYPMPSGKPALRTPAAIGILTTGRTDALDFGPAGLDLTKSGQIRSMQSINAFIPDREYYQINDVLAKRARLIHDTKFLGLDVILVCDQMTKSDHSVSLTQVATLGIVDAGLRKQNTQLTVLCMDARTGYIYGVMGRQEDGRTPRLGIFDANLFGDPDRSHLVTTTRREAVKQFPSFWSGILAKY